MSKKKSVYGFTEVFDHMEELADLGMVEKSGVGGYTVNLSVLFKNGYLDGDVFDKATRQYKFVDEEEQLGSADE